ncbi:MAG: transcriptional regulator [Kiritimatiellae bacterium]|jgi:DNA-binding phage protein|nr:transcriptional regulator [Kiritimatiellia bacterium]
MIMALAIDYKEGVLKDLREDPAMAREYYREAVRAIINGDTATGGVMFRDLVNAGIGFQRLAQETGIRAPNLHRVLSPGGNPTIRTFGKVAAAVAAFMGMPNPMSVFT